jgi:hypothetical protein
MQVEIGFGLHSGILSRCIKLVRDTPSSPVDRKCLVIIDEHIDLHYLQATEYDVNFKM